MNIPEWVFDECKRLNFITNDSTPLEWRKGYNPACMIYKLILIDRKRRANIRDNGMKKVLPRKFEDSHV